MPDEEAIQTITGSSLNPLFPFFLCVAKGNGAEPLATGCCAGKQMCCVCATGVGAFGPDPHSQVPGTDLDRNAFGRSCARAREIRWRPRINSGPPESRDSAAPSTRSPYQTAHPSAPHWRSTALAPASLLRQLPEPDPLRREVDTALCGTSEHGNRTAATGHGRHAGFKVPIISRNS